MSFGVSVRVTALQPGIAKSDNRLHKRVDVPFVGPMIDDRRTNCDRPIDCRGRRRGDPGFVQIGDDVGVELVGIAAAKAEADDVERDRGQQLEFAASLRLCASRYRASAQVREMAAPIAVGRRRP